MDVKTFTYRDELTWGGPDVLRGGEIQQYVFFLI